MRYTFLALICALMFSGCGLVEDSGKDCPMPPAEPSDDIMLSFRMISANIGTRTDEISGHEETSSDWPQFEDLLDINDFAFYIFLDNAENKPLVMRMTNIANSTDPNQMITGAFGAYTITTVIPKHNLEDLLGHELNANTTERVNFRIVLVANLNSGRSGGLIDYNALAPTDAVTAGDDLTKVSTYADFMEKANAIDYNLNYLYSPIQGDSQISGLYKGAIPMFGSSTFSTTEDQLYLSRPEERVYMGEIYMLRSLGKIRVIDNADKDANGYPYISSVYIESATNMLSPLPDDAENYRNGYQVHSPKIVSKSEVSNNCNFSLGTLGMSQNTKGTTRFGYIPEQAIEYGFPTIHITAQLDANRSEVYHIPMQGDADNYPGFTGFNGSILRNHIYTLSVNHIAVGAPADITVNVAPWTQSSLELDYTQTVTVETKLTWTPNTYASNEGGGVYVMKPWETIDGHPTWVPIVGTFGIQTPIGARWDAFLLTLEGDEDAFYFIDKDGNPLAPSEVWGTVDGKTTTTLRIVTTTNNPESVNRAMLQVVVTIGSGAEATVMEADITPEGTSYKNYILVQNPL